MISVKKKDDRPSIPKSAGMKSLPLHLDSFLEYGKFIHSVKETLADRSLNAKLFSEADNRSGEHIDFRAFSDLKILKR